MLHRTVQQFLTDVYFGDLDVLLLDMPPGTGDVAISVGQLLPNADVLVVTTPQAAASDVAVRSGLVARQTGQRVVGRRREHGRDDAARRLDARAVRLGRRRGGRRRALGEVPSQVPLLASIPLSPALRADADAGIPVVVAHPDDPAAVAIDALAAALAAAAARARRAARCRCGRADEPSRSGRFDVERRRISSGRERRRRGVCGSERTRGGDRGRDARGAHGRHRRVVEQRLADDAPRVVLARVERAPVDVVEVRRPSRPSRASCAVESPVAGALGEARESLGVARQSLGPDDEARRSTPISSSFSIVSPKNMHFRLPPRLSGRRRAVRVG